jgi:hypothetical protein
MSPCTTITMRHSARITFARDAGKTNWHHYATAVAKRCTLSLPESMN